MNVAKITLWQLLTALYEEDFTNNPQHRMIIIENIERQKNLLIKNILGEK